ncbi:MAG: 50S ribosomal protein L19 [Bacteroidetes bacterium]|nr:50S ribosomal protein L19 [Bacteroidota bacterium]
MELLKYVENKLTHKVSLPEFKSGDTVTIHYKIKEGDKERIQQYQGVVLQVRGDAAVRSFTVRKISNGVGVERIFPINSPYIDKIEVNKKGAVTKARIFYLRGRSGKKARIEQKYDRDKETTKAATATA